MHAALQARFEGDLGLQGLDNQDLGFWARVFKLLGLGGVINLSESQIFGDVLKNIPGAALGFLEGRVLRARDQGLQVRARDVLGAGLVLGECEFRLLGKAACL